ncbi:MAG: tetratricopeptide repeat protein [Planctomycetes bacterium]|nr:tetratricopeptide repeat protein [Planctomycetota bacterium]
MIAAFALSLCCALAPQDGDLYRVTSTPAADGTPASVAVEADRRRVDCLTALRELSTVMNWVLAIESKQLESDLRFNAVDLNFADQDPRMVAQLVAVAAGADTIFDEPGDFEGARVTLHVVRVPSPDTESGRQRLRAIAGQWYRSFLRDELKYEPVVQQEGLQVRLHLGQLLIENGDLESAIAFYSDVYDQGPHEHIAEAILKIAACHLDLAGGATDRAGERAQYAEAERWLRKLLERMPSAPEIPKATVLLGRALLGEARCEESAEVMRQKAQACQEELRARIIRLIDSVELLEVWLLAGQAQLMMERPDRVYETMLTLRESTRFDDLGPAQFRDYHFLLGYGALGTNKPELAMRSLEWFLINAEDDARRGEAYVLLAESYMQQRRFVEGRAAAVEARSRYLSRMTPTWRQRTLKIWARSALALGEKESAYLELEQMVLRGEEPELTLFLVDELLADRQWQRAIAVARPLTELESAIGDRARFKVVNALYEQALASNYLEDFPAQAIPLAPGIRDPELRAKVATMIGEAYTRLNKPEHAADAFRGILR